MEYCRLSTASPAAPFKGMAEQGREQEMQLLSHRGVSAATVASTAGGWRLSWWHSGTLCVCGGCTVCVCQCVWHFVCGGMVAQCV